LSTVEGPSPERSARRTSDETRDDGPADLAVTEVGELVEVSPDIEGRQIFGVRGHTDIGGQTLAHQPALHLAGGFEIELDGGVEILRLLGSQALEREREQRGDPLQHVQVEDGEIGGPRRRLDDDQADQRPRVEEGSAHERPALDAVQGGEQVRLADQALFLSHQEARLQ
jgi:hypothetical protein